MTRWLLAALRAWLPASVRDAIAGDLQELHAERRRDRGRASAAAWLAVQTLSSAVRYAPRRLARSRDGTGGRMDRLARTIRSSVRRTLRSPGHSTAVVVTMALGLGAAILGFTLVNGVVLTPLPYPQSERIVSVSEDNPDIDISVGWSSLPNYRDFRDRARGFDAMAIFRGRSLSIGTDADPLYAYGAHVSPEFFDVFGVAPELGRTFTADEARVDGPPVVVLSHDLWTGGYGADPGIVGRSVHIDGSPYTVIGVMPEGFTAPAEWVGPGVDLALWRAFPVDQQDDRGNRSYVPVGRLAAGVDMASARAEMERVHAGLREAFPEPNEDWRPQVFAWSEVVVGPAAAALWVLLGTMVLVLAVAGANVVALAANRILARARELATRVALGASRGSVAAQVLADVGLLVALGGALGTALAYGALRGIQALEPGIVPRLAAVSMDASVLAFALVTMAACVLAVGLVASAYALRADPALRLGGGVRAGDRSGSRLRGALSVAQLVLSFALLSAAVTMTRSFLAMNRAPLGFEPEGVTAMTVALSWNRVGEQEDRTRFTTELLAEIRRVPGVVSAGMINSLPLSGSRQVLPIEIDGLTEPGREPAVALRGASPGYLETLRVPVLGGRGLEPGDVQQPYVALVNETATRAYWGGVSPLGTRVRPRGSDTWYTVVGLVGDVLHDGPKGTVLPEVYTPYPLEGLTSKSFVVRAARSTAALAPALRDALRRVDPQQPVREIRSMNDWVALRLASTRFMSALIVAAALLAVVLAAVGLFAALASLVGERRRDIAVRVALGADRGGVIAMVARRAGRMLAPGLAGGLILALALGRVLEGFVFGVDSRDPVTLAGVSAGLLLTALVAASVPVARALSVEPARVLREE